MPPLQNWLPQYYPKSAIAVFLPLISGLDLEHVQYDQTKENNIVSTIKLCDPATVRSKFSSYWYFWHKSASTVGTISISRPSISMDYKSEKNDLGLNFKRTKRQSFFSSEITSGSSSSIRLVVDYTKRGKTIEGYVLFFNLRDGFTKKK